MAKNYAELAFTSAIKVMQKKMGSRASYARMEKYSYTSGLTENEIQFIAQRDSLYMASIGENNFPYIQHRGGPKGFLKVLNHNQIGFIDFTGNRQYITIGNLSTNNNVSLIMVDYPARTRLKIFAKAKIVELDDNPELYTFLDLSEYKFRPERMIIMDVEAYDWNCPQHITPRYSIEEINDVFNYQRNYSQKLEMEIKELGHKLKKQGL
ncbi:pyridoxamine 5'-phosphate oxidase family protein [Gaetbulibacter sp. M235]|uniref:pyridoxamine 5'-phosphate oxidase family protein n=1 Tax=Gaetbulibacter sp. M235 TaxID=3126510 RepID=UPI00374F1AEB